MESMGKTWSKILAGMLSLVMILTMLPSGAVTSWAETGSGTDGIEAEITEDTAGTADVVVEGAASDASMEDEVGSEEILEDSAEALGDEDTVEVTIIKDEYFVSADYQFCDLNGTPLEGSVIQTLSADDFPEGEKSIKLNAPTGCYMKFTDVTLEEDYYLLKDYDCVFDGGFLRYVGEGATISFDSTRFYQAWIDQENSAEWSKNEDVKDIETVNDENDPCTAIADDSIECLLRGKDYKFRVNLTDLAKLRKKVTEVTYSVSGWDYGNRDANSLEGGIFSIPAGDIRYAAHDQKSIYLRIYTEDDIKPYTDPQEVELKIGKNIESFDYYELNGDNEAVRAGRWGKPNTGEQEKGFSEKVTVDNGNSLKICNFTMSNTYTFLMNELDDDGNLIKEIEQNEGGTRKFKIPIHTRTYAASRIELSGNKGMLISLPSSVAEGPNGQDMVKAGKGFAFSIRRKEGEDDFAVTKLTYKIGSKGTAKELSLTNGGYYEIPDEVIREALAADDEADDPVGEKIILTMTTVPYQKVTIRANNNVSSITVTELRPGDTGYQSVGMPKTINVEAAGSEDGAVLSVAPGHILLVAFTPAENTVMTANSCMMNGSALVYKSFGTFPGKCYEAAIAEAPAEILLRAFTPAPVKILEAEGVPADPNGEPYALTATTPTDGVAYSGDSRITKFTGDPVKSASPISISVTAAEGISKNSVKIKTPTAYYETEDGEKHSLRIEATVSPSEMGTKVVPGSYQIPASEVLEAVEAEGTIFIQADAEELPKASFTVEVEKDSPIKSNIEFTCIKKDPYDESEAETIDTGAFTGEGDFLKKELTVAKGTRLEVTYFDFGDSGNLGDSGQSIKDVTFIRITDVTDPQNPVEIRRGSVGENWTFAPEDGGIYRFETAVLKTSEIGYLEDVPDSVRSVSEMYSEQNEKEYVSNGWTYEQHGYEFGIEVTQQDQPKKMIAASVTAAVTNGKPASVSGSVADPSKPDARTYELPYQTLTDAAFAEANANGKKIVVSATIVQSGYFRQTLNVPEQDYLLTSLSVKSGTKAYDPDFGTARAFYSIPYGETLTVKADPQPGVALTAGYVLTDQEKVRIDSDAEIADKRAEYLKSAKKYEASSNGVVTIPFEKYTDTYWLFFEEDPDAAEEVLIVTKARKEKDNRYYPDRMLESAGSREIEDVSLPYYEIGTVPYYTVEYRKGTRRLPVENVSMTCEGEDVTDLMVKSADLIGEDEENLILINSGGITEGSITVKLAFTVKTGEGAEDAEQKSVLFDLTPSMTETSVKFAASDLSEGKLGAYYSAERSCTLTLTDVTERDFDVELWGRGRKGLSYSYYEFSLDGEVWTRISAGETEGTAVLTIGVKNTFRSFENDIKKDSGGYKDVSYHLGFRDRETGLLVKDQEFTVSSALPVIPETFVAVDALASDYNTITVDLSGITYPFENAEELYFLVSAATEASDFVPLKKQASVLVKAPADKAVIALSDSSNAFRTDSLAYKVNVLAVLIKPGKEEYVRDGKSSYQSYILDRKSIITDTVFPVDVKDQEDAEEEGGMLASNNFATKLSLTKTAAGKKKIYTGMEPFTYVNVGYSVDKKTKVTRKQLDKAELKDKSGEIIASTKWDSGIRILSEGDEDKAIVIDPSQIPAGKYDLIVYAKQPMGVSVSAKTALTVLQGIEGLKVTTPSKAIYKKPKKEASLKAAVSYEPAKPATKKVKWYLVDPDYDPADGVPGEDDLFTGLTKKEISIKNGTVKIKKNVQINEELEFAIAAVPADYEHGASNYAIGKSEPIRITTYSPQPAHIYLMRSMAGGSYSSGLTELVNGGDYPVGKLASTYLVRKNIFASESGMIEYLSEIVGVNLMVLYGGGFSDEDLSMPQETVEKLAKVQGGHFIFVTDEDGNILSDVKLKAAGMKWENGFLCCDKPQKNITLTAEMTDGSGKSLKVKFNAVSGTDAEYLLLAGKPGIPVRMYSFMAESEAAFETGSFTKLDVTDGKAVNTGAGSLYFSMNDPQYNTVTHTLKVTGGKILNKKAAETGRGAIYEIKPTAKETVIRITDKSTNKTSTFKVENTLFTKSKTKTKVKASNTYVGTDGKLKNNKGKIFRKVVFNSEEDYENAGSPNKVTYTVMKGKKAYPAKTNVRITITKDVTYMSFMSIYEIGYLQQILEMNTQSGLLCRDEHGNLIATLDSKGSFSIDYTVSGKMDLPAGKYAFTLTPVDANGYAVAKSVTVNVKAVDAPKAKIRLNTKDFSNFGTGQPLVISGTENVIWIDKKPNAYFGGEVDLLGANTKGKISNFANCFMLDYTYDEAPALALLRPLTAADGYTGKKGKESITGYVAVTLRRANGEYETQYLKVTLKGVTAPEAPEP